MSSVYGALYARHLSQKHLGLPLTAPKKENKLVHSK